MRRPKAVIGYSDVSALHCAIAARGRVVTFHAHTARAVLPSMSAQSVYAAVTGTGEPCGVWEAGSVVRAGVATGRLTGGNVSLLASLCGTSSAMRGDGAIVVLEDVNESVYRLDRLLRQLEQSGALRGCVGLVAGQFTQVPADEHDGATTIDALVSELADRLAVPCLANLPIGHIADQWTLPLGAEATLDVSARSLRIGDATRGLTVG
jgi:muramoyltetrapeptide carboxypeptidase